MFSGRELITYGKNQGNVKILIGKNSYYNFSPIYKIHKKFAITSLRLYGDGLQKLEEISRDCISDFMVYIEEHDGVEQDYCKVVTTTVVNVITSMVRTPPAPPSPLPPTYPHSTLIQHIMCNIVTFLSGKF